MFLGFYRKSYVALTHKIHMLKWNMLAFKAEHKGVVLPEAQLWFVFFCCSHLDSTLYILDVDKCGKPDVHP